MKYLQFDAEEDRDLALKKWTDVREEDFGAEAMEPEFSFAKDNMPGVPVLVNLPTLDLPTWSLVALIDRPSWVPIYADHCTAQNKRTHMLVYSLKFME